MPLMLIRHATSTDGLIEGPPPAVPFHYRARVSGHAFGLFLGAGKGWLSHMTTDFIFRFHAGTIASNAAVFHLLKELKEQVDARSNSTASFPAKFRHLSNI